MSGGNGAGASQRAVSRLSVARAAGPVLHQREQILAVAAHELRAPVATLQAGVDLLQMLAQRRVTHVSKDDRAEFKRVLRAVNKQTRKLHQLVSNLLDASRLGAGKLVLKCQFTDVAVLVRRVSREAAAGRSRSAHRVVVRAPRRLRAVVDGPRLEQVLCNLLDNARKFSPNGGEITVVLDRPSPTSLRIRVQDQGIGVATVHLPHLFEQHYQAHGAGDGYGGGLGLGLYICREIVAAHGGYIAATAPEEGGLCMTVTLPIGGAQDKVASPWPRRVGPGNPLASDGRSRLEAETGTSLRTPPVWAGPSGCSSPHRMTGTGH